MPKKLKNNNNEASPRQNAAPVLAKMRRRVAVQAALALTTIVLTIVIVFAMSAAWYTNIVHTSGLTFQVEAWGFNGEIISDMVPIVAGPGDDGVISLEVASESNSPSAVSVSFSKTKMPAPMQQRIFFYVDTQMTRNGETMDRVYLNSQQSYTYQLFNMGKLTLTETMHNDAQLKWHWVYDVLGYYVQGTMLSDGESLSITEYLRPIEYDYDQATMAYVTENGVTTMELLTVDGTLSLEDYLVQVSETDGYEGTIDPEEKLLTGYYPVEVDANGNGVYAYLCTYAEIQYNTQYDTQLGQQAQEGIQEQYEARLMVSAQKSKNNVVNVASLASLKTIIESGGADVIELTSNITIGTDEQLIIAAGQDAMLDLNGYQIITTDPNTIPILVQEGGSLTMVDGELIYQNDTLTSDTYAIQAVGAEVVMSNVDLSGYELGMKVSDSSGTTGQDSSVRLIGCNWSTNDCALLVYGNGSASEQKTRIIIEDSVLHSNDITLCGNGSVGSSTSSGNYGTDIQIINSTVTSNPAKVASGIYQPQKDSVLTIYNSTVSGYTGICVKGGTVNIVGSTIEGHGAGMDVVEKFANSGFNDTGDAVYIETNYGYDIRLNISDAEITQADGTQTKRVSVLSSSSQYALRVYDPNAANVKIQIISGQFSDIEADGLSKFMTYVDAGSETSVDQVTGYRIVTIKPEQTDPPEEGEEPAA